ncbi:MAG: ATP-binding protein [Proteobacteria bacterium]|jgi:signal transduction histidine kinase|nr:ATP-binding protein [Pseudomonadota bacterium]MCC6630639.1 ATP-binding protein [Gammaproteobacteria bacterium]
MLDDNLPTILEVVEQVKESAERLIELDASAVVTLQPAAVCLIASAARTVRDSGKVFQIRQLNEHLQPLLLRLDPAIQITGAPRAALSDPKPGEDATVARVVITAGDANAAVNELANYIARFIPKEDEEEMVQDQYGLLIHHAIQPALAHVLSELVDNVFSHAATAQFPNPHAYIAVQSYPTGDLLRVAVVDDGCGLQASLRALDEDPPRSHFEAASRAFQPFTSSKSGRSMYAERRHMGLGLPVCREICRQLGGRMYAATGNAWVRNPGMGPQEDRTTTPFFQGTAISLELYRRGVTNRLLQDVLAKFSGPADLRLRFT